MSLQTQAFYEFGHFHLNATERQLTRDGEVVALTPKVYDLLLVLVKNSGRMVDKEELMGTLWPDTFVEEGNLTQNVSTLRKALGENTNGQGYIETIPKHGYRFVADVSAVSENGWSDSGKIEVIPPPVPVDQPRTRTWMTKRGILAVALVLVGLAIGTYIIRKQRMPKPPTENHDAFILYLKGNDAFTAHRWSDAVEYLTQAVKKDEKFALAYAELSTAYMQQGPQGNEKPMQVLERAELAARKALELDENLVEAQSTLGRLKMTKYRDWSGAKWHFDRAIALNPKSPDGYRYLALLLQTTGDLDPAIEARRMALFLRPDNLRLRSELAVSLRMARPPQLEEAEELLNSVLARERDDGFAHWQLGQLYLQQGRWDDAIAEFNQVKPDDEIVAHLSYAYARKGNQKEGERFLRILLDKSAGGQYVSAFRIAIAYTGLNNKDQAFKYLNLALEDRTNNMSVKVNPIFNDLQQDPRFNLLLQHAGLDK